MIKEIIYAQETCGNFVKITIIISEPYWSEYSMDWACSLELSSEDSKLGLATILYNVTPISVLTSAFKFIATLIIAEEKQSSWKLCYSTEPNEYIGNEYPLRLWESGK